MTKLDPERVAQIAEKAARMGSLKEHPGWQDLIDVVDREEKRYFDQQYSNLRAGQPVDQDETRVKAQVFDLVRYLLAHPEKAEQTLGRALEKAERLGLLHDKETM